jgi:hypothetical protein
VDSPLFSLLDSTQTNINFTNIIKESNYVNYFKYEYMYNGGGVAVGDINNDGLPDIYLTGNLVPNRLYLNKGGLKFEDITIKAKASSINDWSTGVTMADVNNDGWLDIYVCRSGWVDDPVQRRNLLFINNTDGTFTEKALSYGIGDTGYSTQATFFDFDKDGDLDLYVANHPHLFRQHVDEFLRKAKNPPEDNRDKLYRNDGGQFTEVSREAGILNYAHTLGIVATDFNQDGWVDLYISNDFQEADIYYQNNGDGTFSDQTSQAMKHTAKFSMGVDAKDFNNDGWMDLMAVEMMAEDNKRQKTNMAPMNPKLFWDAVSLGFGYQYMHNVLQLNNGPIPGTVDSITFSEIAYLSGVATTDWSWAPLFADFDNDGYKDLFVSNGFRRDVLDKDFKKKLKKFWKDKEKAKYEELEPLLPSTLLPNYMYRNNGDLTFSNTAREWGLSQKVNSNGATYADLDLDGDLDLIVNNIDAPALVYQNNADALGKSNSIQIKFKGPDKNPLGLGVKVQLKTPDGWQYEELTLSRGFQSSVEPVLHFGLGKYSQADQIKILWPDNKVETLSEVPAGESVLVDYTNARESTPAKADATAGFIFQKSRALGAYTHREKAYDDYKDQVLLPHKLSQNGPGMAVGDINNDQLDDLYIGGAAGQAGQLFLQDASGAFIPAKASVFEKDKGYEDMGAIFFDANGDQSLDLYVVSGSYEFPEQSKMLQDRLYLNDGSGQFTRAENALPALTSSGSCVIAADFDKDNDLDLFVGGRVVPKKYPQSPSSYILQNDQGVFKDVTAELAPELQQIGMVTAALWTDYDNDSYPDLLLAGEWMPICLFQNQKGEALERAATPGLDNSSGWWNSICGGDFDNDGDIDYILGNMGLNSKNQASPAYPFHIYAKDFDESGSFDIVLGYYNKGIQYPVRGLQCSSEQIPELASKIPTFEEFGNLTIEGIYGAEELENALHLEVVNFSSSYLENRGSEGFTLHPLPLDAQFGPTYGQLVEDFDGDGCLDVLIAGNQYPVEVETGRYDAHKGLLLRGDCAGGFEAVLPRASGFFVDGDTKSMSMISLGGDKGMGVLVAENDGPVHLFELSSEALNLVRLEENVFTIMENLGGNKERKREFYIGSGYLSQQSGVYRKVLNLQ